MLKTVRVLRENWAKTHRRHGGIGAVGRCLTGQLRLTTGAVERRLAADDSSRAEVDVVTFSVIPWLTALWARLLPESPAVGSQRLLVGDCSGGFLRAQRAFAGGDLETLPCLNHHHGEKLDLFFHRASKAELVLVCDDDIFWLGRQPLDWAIERMKKDPTLAVVSLAPRQRLSEFLGRQVEEAMGSSCLLIRRSIWEKQQLSFRRKAPEPGSDWFFDTCDQAQVQLLAAGFKVEIAPLSVRSDLVTLEAISAWLLKLSKHGPQRILAAADDPLRVEKALRAVETARQLGALLRRRVPTAELLPAAMLNEAVDILTPGLNEDGGLGEDDGLGEDNGLEKDRAATIRDEVQQHVERIRLRLEEVETREAI